MRSVKFFKEALKHTSAAAVVELIKDKIKKTTKSDNDKYDKTINRKIQMEEIQKKSAEENITSALYR